MDFIAIDLDKYDVWQAFIRPVPVRAQMYVKTANWDPGSPSEEHDCPPDSDPNDACFKDSDDSSQQTIGQASPSFGGSGPDGGYQEPGADPNTGFGGGGLTEEQMACHAEQTAESEVDRLAQEISDEIGGKGDRRRREYGAAILVDSEGNYRRSTLTPGTYSQVNVEFAVRPGERLVAIVHNHPGGNTGPSSGDWAGARDFVEGINGQPQIADADDYSEYIRDDRGRLAEFDYDTDRNRNSANTETRNDAESKC